LRILSDDLGSEIGGGRVDLAQNSLHPHLAPQPIDVTSEIMPADIRRWTMSKEAFFSPISQNRTSVTGLQFNRTPKIALQLPRLIASQGNYFRKRFRTAVRFPKTGSNGIASRFDKPFAFSGNQA
jgi:hypothetical protein